MRLCPAGRGRLYTGPACQEVPAVNAPHEMDHIEVLRLRLSVLEREHRDLDEAIRALESRGTGDALTLRRLKKQKLALKDRIRRIEDEINPDIIA
jgi:hypothetical protein